MLLIRFLLLPIFEEDQQKLRVFFLQIFVQKFVTNSRHTKPAFFRTVCTPVRRIDHLIYTFTAHTTRTKGYSLHKPWFLRNYLAQELRRISASTLLSLRERWKPLKENINRKGANKNVRAHNNHNAPPWHAGLWFVHVSKNFVFNKLLLLDVHGMHTPSSIWRPEVWESKIASKWRVPQRKPKSGSSSYSTNRSCVRWQRRKVLNICAHFYGWSFLGNLNEPSIFCSIQFYI